MNLTVIKRTVKESDIGTVCLFPRTSEDSGAILPLEENKPLRVDLKGKNRSIEQNEFYWKVIVPVCQYFLDELNHCPNPKNKTDIDNAHYTLKLLYCLEVRPDLIETVKYFDPTDKTVKERGIPFSAQISKMSQKNFNAYLDWIKKRVNLASGLHWDQATQQIK